MKEVSTLAHRAICSATRPEDGWPPPPNAAKLARSKIGDVRRRLLDTRGLLVLCIPAPPTRQHGFLEWIRAIDPNNPALDEATWYFDGSMLDGKVDLIRATGFGLAVIGANGDLLGTARGVPPQWCYTAAAAEAWALLEVLRQTPMIPKMRTDCLTLVKTARQGAESATAANRPLARIWVDIARILDGDITALERTNLLVWQPAHQTVAGIGQRHGSDGKKITTVDWRANRLVDALAKQAAELVRASKETRNLLQSGRLASIHAGCALGRITYAANNHRVETTNSNGEVHVEIRRDSQEAPPKKPNARTTESEAKAAKAAAAEQAAEAAKQAANDRSSPKRPAKANLLKEEPPLKRPCVLAASRARHEKCVAEHTALERVIQERTSQLAPSTAQPASEILARIRGRVRARANEPPPEPP